MHEGQLLLLLLYIALSIFVFIFTLVMIWRFVTAVERIAKNVELGARLYKYQVDTNAGNNQGTQENRK
jgi:hypothetical protein